MSKIGVKKKKKEQMFYDPEKNILYDTETGDEIPIIDDVEYPEEIKQQIQLKRDHDYALQLHSGSGSHSQSNTLTKSSTKYLLDNQQQQQHNDYTNRRNHSHHHYDNIPADGEMKMQQELIELRMNEAPDVPINLNELHGEGQAGGWMDDFTLARALQAMEFEIAGETLDRGDFDEKEYRASSCKRQILTISTLILLTQV